MSRTTTMEINLTPQSESWKQFLEHNLFWNSNGQATVLAGGAPRHFFTGEEPNDFDMFIVGEEQKEDIPFLANEGTFKERFVSHLDQSFENRFRCPEGLLYTYKTPFGKLQLVTPTTYQNIETLRNTFDISACCFVYEMPFGVPKIHTDAEAIADVWNKVVRLRNVTYPLATMYRVFKYRGYGYNIYDATLELVRRIREETFEEGALYLRYID